MDEYYHTRTIQANLSMKYLVGIPCLYGAGHTLEAIESVAYKEDVSLVIVDNGAEEQVKNVISAYDNWEKVTVIHNKENIYVNPAWNQIIKNFLSSDSDYLLIMNSDLILRVDWKTELDAYLSKNPNDIPVPLILTNKDVLNRDFGNSEQEVFEGTPGVLIILNKVQANLIYPIPETIKVWFGDNWIYEGLRKLGYKTVVLSKLVSYHSGSQNVSKVKGISEIIENDKLEWAKLQ